MPQDTPQDRPISIDEFEEQRRQYYGIPKGLAASLRQQESGGQHYDKAGGVLTSPKQAKGRYQVLKSTAAQYGLNADDPFENIEAGFRYMADLHKKVDAKVTDPGERWASVVAGYHSGEGGLNKVNKTGNMPGTNDGMIQTQDYVSSIMRRWQEHDARERGQSVTPTQPQGPAPEAAPIVAAKPLVRPAKPGPIRNPQRGPLAPTANPFATNQGATGFQEQAQAINARTGNISPDVAARADAAGRELGKYQQKSTLGKIGYDLKTGYQGAANTLADQVANLGEVAGGIATGNFRSAMEQAEGAGRGLIKVASGLTPGGGAMRAKQDQAIAALQQRQQARRANDPYWAGSRETQQNIEARKAVNPSLAAQTVRGGTEAAIGMLPIVAASAAGGGLPAVMGITAAQQDYTRPDDAMANLAGAYLSTKAGQAISPAAATLAQRIGGPAKMPTIPQEIARRGIEGAAGGLTNTAQYAGTQLATGRPIDTQEAITQGITGAGMGMAMAPGRRATGDMLARDAVQNERPGLMNLRPTLQVDATPQAEGPATYSTRPNAQQTRITKIPQGAEYALLSADPDSPVARTGPKFAPAAEASAQATPAGNLAGIRVIAEGERIPASQRRNVKTIVVKQPDGSMQSVRAMLPEGMTPGQARQVLQGAQKAQAKAAPPPTVAAQPTTEPLTPEAPAQVNPRQAARNENIQKAHEDSVAARTQAEAASREGRHDEAIKAYRAEADALRALRDQIPNKSRGGRVRRVEAGDRLTQIQEDVKAVRLAQRQAAKGQPAAPQAPRLVDENAPTADLTAPLVPDAPQTARMPEAPNRTTADLPRPMPRTTAEIPRPVDAPMTEPTNQLRNADYPGGEVPRTAGLRPEGQPVEIPVRPEPEYTEWEGGEVRNYDYPQVQGQPVGVGSKQYPPNPKAPPLRARAGRGPQQAYGPTTMTEDFPKSRRALRFGGERVAEKVKEFPGGGYGDITNKAFKSYAGDVEHAHDSFFHDPEIKGALGLTRDAEQGDIKAALNREFGRLFGIQSGEISLTHVSPEMWRNWAKMKGFSPEARAKLETAIERGRQQSVARFWEDQATKAEKRENAKKTVNPPDSGPPRPVPTDAGSTPKAPSNYKRYSDANTAIADELAGLGPERLRTPEGKARRSELVKQLRQSAKQYGVKASDVNNFITETQQRQMRAAQEADAAQKEAARKAEAPVAAKPAAAPPWPKMTPEQSAAWESDIAGGKPANARKAEAPPVAETRPRAVSEAEAAPIAEGDAGKAAPNQVARKIHQIVEDEATGTKQHGYQAESGFYDRYESLDMPERQVLLKELVRLGSLPKGWDRKKNPSPGEILREMRSTAQRKAQQAQYEARTRIPDGAFPVAVPPAPKAERPSKDVSKFAEQAKPEGSTVEKGDVVMWQGKPHKVTVGVDYIGLSEILTDRGDIGQSSRGWKTSESFEKDTGYKATFLDPKIERTKAKAEARKYSPRSTHRNAKEWVDDHVSKGFTEVERYAAPGQKTIFNLRNPETNESFTIAGVEREYAEAVAKNLTDYDASTGARVPRKGVADASAARIAKAKPAPEAAPPAAQPETPRSPGATVERAGNAEASAKKGLPDVPGLREHYLREAAQHNAEADKLADEDAKAYDKRISAHRRLAIIAETKAARIDDGAHSLIKPTAEEDAAVTAASRKQKEIPRVGLTPAQADYLRGKVAEVKPRLEEEEKAITIRVPDDGQFTVRTPEQADKLIERLKSPIVSEYKPPRPTNPRENAKMPGDIGESTKTAPTYNDQVEGAYPLEKVTPGGWNGNATTHKGWVTDGHTAMRTDKMTPAKKASLGKLGKLGGRLSPEKFDAFVDDMAKRLTGPRSQGAQIEDLVAVGGKLGQGGQVAIAKTDNGEIISLDARQLANIIESVDFDTVRAQTGSDAISGSIGFFKGDKLQALAMPLKQDEREVPRAQNLIAEARKPRVKGSVGKLDREESGGPVVGSGFGALQGAFKSKPPSGADLDAWMDRMGNAIPETMTDAQISRFDDLVNRAADAAEAGNAREWKRLSRQAEQMIFTRKDRAIAEVSGAMNATRSLMASGDLSAPLRQGAILTLPPSQWGKAGRAAKRMFQALSAGKYERLKQEIQVHPDFDAAEEAGLYLATNDSGRMRGEEDFLRNNSLASRIMERMPILAHSERAYKMYLDSLRMDTFAKYKHVIEKGGGTDEQKAKALKSAAEWINVATGRGSLGKKFDESVPLLSTIFFAPRYTASRIQVLNPATYAKNMGNPASRQVFRRQMSEMFQSAAVLTTTAALAKYGLGATVNLDDPESPDWLKIKIGDTRYDVGAGLQQIARLGARIGKYLDTSVRGTEKEQGAASDKMVRAVKTFGRSKLGPVPSFFVDWLNNWTNVIGERHTPGEASTKNPIVSRITPLLWADMVDAYREGGAGKAARFTPGVFGVGVQDYDVNKKRKAETKARVRPKTPPMPGPPKGFGEL